MPMEKKSKKRVAVVAALVAIALTTVYLVAIIIPLVRETMGVGIAVAILVVYGALIFASMVGITCASPTFATKGKNALSAPEK